MFLFYFSTTSFPAGRGTGGRAAAEPLLGPRAIAQIPLVYATENTGTSCAAPPLPDFTQLPTIEPLPDPFRWAAGRGRSTSFVYWECHRNEFRAEIENYEISTKPPRPQTITASYVAGITAGTGTLTVNVTVNGKTADAHLAGNAAHHRHRAVRGHYRHEESHWQRAGGGVYRPQCGYHPV